MPSSAQLIMASTAIGLPEDIPSRTLEAVRNADLVVFEEDRPARAILKAAGIHRDYRKYSEQKQEETLSAIRETLKTGGTVCYCSDQGCPNLEDPGSPVVQIAYETRSKILVIPGPSSLTAALSACPFSTRGFIFAGLIARKNQERQQNLQDLRKTQRVVVILDAPYRLKALLSDAKKIYGPKHGALLSLDISGPAEDHLWQSLAELEKFAEKLEQKLNFVLVLEASKNYRKG